MNNINFWNKFWKVQMTRNVGYKLFFLYLKKKKRKRYAKRFPQNVSKGHLQVKGHYKNCNYSSMGMLLWRWLLTGVPNVCRMYSKGSEKLMVFQYDVTGPFWKDAAPPLIQPGTFRELRRQNSLYTDWWKFFSNWTDA